MATITESIYTRLSGIAAVTALCPASRILPPGNWQNIARPYIIHFPVSLTPTQTHEGQQILRIWERYQISVFSDDFATGDALAVAIHQNLPGVVSSGIHIFSRPGAPYFQGVRPVAERETSQVFQFILEFRIAEAL